MEEIANKFFNDIDKTKVNPTYISNNNVIIIPVLKEFKKEFSHKISIGSETETNSNINKKNTSHFLDGNNFFISRLNHHGRIFIRFALSNDAYFIHCLIKFL